MMSQLLTIFGPILGDVVKKIVPDTDKHKQIEQEVKLGTTRAHGFS